MSFFHFLFHAVSRFSPHDLIIEVVCIRLLIVFKSKLRTLMDITIIINSVNCFFLFKIMNLFIVSPPFLFQKKNLKIFSSIEI